jgi:hypothetical protein
MWFDIQGKALKRFKDLKGFSRRTLKNLLKVFQGPKRTEPFSGIPLQLPHGPV